jgi:F-type H+-transporting ATPase subunit b
MEILQQIGQLVLGSVPTMLLFLFLVLAYRLLVHAPLTRTLAQRREQTEGAMEKAKEAIAAAEAKTHDYEERLRAARRSLQAAREQQLLHWTVEREEALKVAREIAHHRAHEALAEIQASADASRKVIEGSSQQLAALIVAHLLSPAATQAERAH